MSAFRTFLAVLALGAVSCSVRAADSDTEFVKRVNKAIDNGKRFLLAQEGGRGNWEGVVLENLANQVGGQTALATLALLNCGVPAEDKAIQRALEFLRNLPREKTYVVALTTMVYAEARQTKDLERIQKNADWLLANTIREGGKLRGWSYPMNPIPDASNTQYALLGLYAAKQAGIKIDDKHWAEIRELYLSVQKQDKENVAKNEAYWTYDYTRNFGGLSGASFTMTSAGVCGLLIAGMGLNASEQKLDELSGVAANCGVYASNGPVAKGMNWIANRFNFDNVPGLKSVFYNIYGIERLGRISGQRFIGKYDWYREGCDYLTRTQNATGSWTGNGKAADSFPNVATSFSLLFLSKGRTPILMTKLAFDTGLGEPREIIGWNRKQNDVRHLTEFASRELFNGLPLAWQVYDARKVDLTGEKLKAEVESLLTCPVVYLNGHTRPNLTGTQKDLLKKYVDEGGFIFAEACCGSEEFAREFKVLMRELFPENQMTPMGPEHPVWRSFFNVSPADIPGVECLERGCKTVVVLSTKPLAGYWEENRFMVSKGVPATNRGQRAYQFAGNVIAYATGMQPPEQRGSKVAIADAKNDLTPPRGALKPAQLRLKGDNPPAPAAMRNLMAHIKTTTGVDTILDKQMVSINDPELDKYKFIYMHGRRAIDIADAELKNLADGLDTGGLLFADSACGKPEFDKSFREMVKKLYPERKLEPIPLTDDLFSAKMGGVEIKTVQRREKADGTGTDGGYKDLPPALEGIKIDGRWVVIYSKFDIGCALERHKSTDCLGHSPESALRLGTAAVLYSLKR
jgi:Domain of unknown function (DUF4159)